MKGRFISLEGTEGAGKSTNIAFVKSYLESKGLEVVVTREPGGTVIGESVREILLNPVYTEMLPDTELLLMFAARSQHIQEKILPAIAEGKWVISDRFTDSTYAYQGSARNIDVNRIKVLEDWTQKGFRPDKTLFLDLPIDVGMQRVLARGGDTDRFEGENRVFFESVRQGFLERAADSKSRCEIIDASLSLAEVQNSISTCLDELMDSAIRT